MPAKFLEFRDSRDRIRRADTHRREVAEIWNGFMADEPYVPFVDVDDEGNGTIRIVQQRPIPRRMSLRLGEMFYQLRAALDACVYGAAIRDSGQDPPPKPQQLEFPIFTDKGKFQNATRKIRPLAQKRRSIIETVQPYNASSVGPDERFINDSLGLLHDLARKDRHRRLRVIGAWASEASPQLRLPEGTELTYMSTMPDCFLKGEREIAEFHLSGWGPDMEIQANPDLFVDVALDESMPQSTGPHLLREMCESLFPAVETVVDRIESSF